MLRLLAYDYMFIIYIYTKYIIELVVSTISQAKSSKYIIRGNITCDEVKSNDTTIWREGTKKHSTIQCSYILINLS